MRRITLFVFALSVLLIGCEKDNDRPVLEVIPPDSDVAGYTYDEVAGMWWAWALDIPRATNPMGEGDCDQNQSGDIWFLAGTGAGGTHTRTCTIPAGKTIVFPILNNVNWSCPEVWGAADECPFADATGLAEAATGYGVIPVELEMELNGRPYDGDLTIFYSQSEAFPFTYSGSGHSWLWYPQDAEGAGKPATDIDCLAPWEPGNACGVPAGPKLIIGSGYYVAVQAPEPGKHTLRFAGVLNPDEQWYSLDLTYELTITAN